MKKAYEEKFKNNHCTFMKPRLVSNMNNNSQTYGLNLNSCYDTQNVSIPIEQLNRKECLSYFEKFLFQLFTNIPEYIQIHIQSIDEFLSGYFHNTSPLKIECAKYLAQESLKIFQESVNLNCDMCEYSYNKLSNAMDKFKQNCEELTSIRVNAETKQDIIDYNFSNVKYQRPIQTKKRERPSFVFKNNM